MNNYEKVAEKILYEGYYKLHEYEITNGERSLKREVFDRGQGVAAIVFDTVKKKYLFVKQYRAGAEGDMVEVVAGCIDEGEKVEETLKREIVEELGYKTDTIQHILDFYTSPASTNEIVSLFYVEVSEKISDGGGVDDEKIEIIEVDKLGNNGLLIFDPDENGNILPPYRLIDAKSIMAVNWVESNRVLREVAEIITNSRLRSL